MNDKKKKVILFFAVIIIAIVIVILAIVFGKKETDNFEHTANNTIVSSLNASSQKEVDDAIIEDLEKNKYSLKNAKVYVDPYGASPLSALVAFKTDAKTTVKITVKGKDNNDITINYKEAEYHYIPVYALYQDYENTIEVSTGKGEKTTIKIPIAKIENLPSSTVKTSPKESLNDDLYLITSPITMSSFGVDSYGEVRWIPNGNLYRDIRILDNGHILIGTNDTNQEALATRIIEIDLLGRIYNEYYIDEGYLGNFFVKSDGNILLASKKEGRETYSDYILEISGKTGQIVKTWDIFEILSSIDSEFTSNLNGGFFYNSGIEYYESTNTLLLTYWGGEAVINLGYSDNSVRWIFSDPKNFSNAFSSVLLKGGDGFTYPKSMHSATLEGDTLRVFDNGYSTNKGDSNISHLKGSFSSANTYKVSGKNISLESSIDEGKTLFSYALADYNVSNGMDIVLFGRELKDIDYDKNIDINEWDNLATRLIEKKDGKTILDIEINCSTQTVDKFDLSETLDFEFTTPESYTTLKPSKKESITKETLDMIKEATKEVEYKFGYSKKMIEHNVLFMSDDEAKLILINDENEGAVYNLKVKGKYQSEKIVTNLPEGEYYVYILENGVMCKTDSIIKIS